MLPYPVRGSIWIIVYLLFILAPLFALLAGAWPPARGFWTEFSVAIGYSGLAMMGLQFGLTARFRYVTEPWGEDLSLPPLRPSVRPLPVLPYCAPHSIAPGPDWLQMLLLRACKTSQLRVTRMITGNSSGSS
jgi:hypothetical protein